MCIRDRFNNDPLDVLEEAELLESTIEGFDFVDSLSNAIALFFVFCIPFSVIISFLSRQLVFKLRNKGLRE